mgnify:CR=1 FL=1
MFMQTLNVLTNSLQYDSILRSIKRVIRLYNFILPFSYEIVCPFRPHIIKVICCSKTGCRPLYDVLNLNDFHLKSQKNLITELNIQDNFGWEFVFDLPFYLTKDSKLQWFQFKIVHRIIETNHLLSKMGLKEHDYCSFCNQYPETIEHLFWDCTHVDMFWRSLKTWLTNDFNTDVFSNWSNIEIILGNRRTQKYYYFIGKTIYLQV